jgi:uncharacterized integral membrane protein
MSTHGEQPKSASPVRRMLRKFSSTVGILFILLYVVFFASDVYDYFHSKPTPEPPSVPSNSFAAAMKLKVQTQLTRLESVDPMGLLRVYDNALNESDCTWYFRCSAKPPQPSPIDALLPGLTGSYATKPSLNAIEKADQIVAADRANRQAEGSLSSDAPVQLGPTLPDLPGTTPPPESSPSAAPLEGLPQSFPEPAPAPLVHIPSASQPDASDQHLPLDFFGHFFRIGPILIPTWATIRGTPYALWKMIDAIHDAGWRAEALYLSCTVIFAFLWLAAANAKDSNGYFIYTTLVLSPLCISLMVLVVQWITKVALNTFGWVIGMFAIILAHATALALIVGARHILKTPRELAEEIEKLA